MQWYSTVNIPICDYFICSRKIGGVEIGEESRNTYNTYNMAVFKKKKKRESITFSLVSFSQTFSDF
jgi:hypothetical protein